MKLVYILIDKLLENRRIDKVTGCWLYTGYRDVDWYGIINFDNKKYKVHRLIMYICCDFDLTSELLVLHKCDRPSCFNPLHLFIGTHQDNTNDMISKGHHHEMRKTECPMGHKYDRIYNGRRHCSICDISRARNYKLTKLKGIHKNET